MLSAIASSECYPLLLNQQQPKYSIIIPAYNERERIGTTLRRILDYLREQRWAAEILVVDDGSRDNTVEIVSRLAAENSEVWLLQNPGNQGKGFAVRHGMLKARGEILLFSDADLSSPIEEAPKLFSAIKQGADIAMGSRWLDSSLQFERQPLRRRVFSRFFNVFLRIILGLNFHDTQCGFKAFTRRSAEMIFPLQLINRWGFDAEILYIARRRGLRIVEIPVAWGHDDRSTIHPLRDGLRMGIETLKVRWNAIVGKYSKNIGSSDHREIRSSGGQ